MLQYIKYTKWINIVKGIVFFLQIVCFEQKVKEEQQQQNKKET